jgi:AcrR family transcriptional regulator
MPKRSAAAAADTRAALIAAGRALFAERGFAGATTGEISGRADVTEGAFFHHFAGKRALFEAVFAELEGELTRAATKAVASSKASALDAFLSGCRVYLDHAERPEFARVVMIDAPVVLGVEGWRARDTSLGLAAMIAGVEALIQTRVIPRQPSKVLAVLILGALNEAGLAIARGESGVSARGCIASLRRLLSPAK